MTKRYAAKHGKNLQNTINALQDRQPFNAGNLKAFNELQQLGKLPHEYHAEITQQNPDYVVYSYYTPIAWHTETNGWTIPDNSYSVTTTNHQNLVRRAVA